MGMTAAITGAGALLGGLAGSKNSKATQTQTSTPWAPQAEGLQTAYDQAKNLLDTSNGRPAWEATNPTTAAQNATQQAGYGIAADYAQGTGTQLANQMSSTAGVLMGAAPSYVSNAGVLASNGAGAANGTAQGVLSGLANGQTAGATLAGATGQAGQIGALGTAQQLAAAGQVDNTPGILGGVSAFYNADQVGASQAAARDDITNTLTTQALPTLNAHAMAGGNVNSARAGAAESVARGEAARAIASSDAAISGNAYNTAVSAALQNQSQQNALALGGNAQAVSAAGALSGLGEQQRQFDTGTQLSAATALGSQDTANRALDAQTRLSANNQLGSAVGLGYEGALSSSNLANQNAGAVIAQGDAQQAEAQRQLDEQQTRYYANEERQKGALADYYGIVGSGNWGSSSTTTATTPGPGVLAGALGGASAGFGMAQPGGILSGSLGGEKPAALTGGSGVLSGLKKSR